MSPAVRYRSPDEDSARWQGFPFREGDIVISTRSKHGTTWMQMICALLVFQSPQLPAPLGELSPWLDWLVEPLDDVVGRLEAQDHRRVIKTHTPLDGIPINPGVFYVVVTRHPLDAAISLYHQGDNLDRERLLRLMPQRGHPAPPSRPTLRDWLAAWIRREAEPAEDLDSLAGVMWHLTDAWRRRNEANVILVHFQGLSCRLADTMHLLAHRLGVHVHDPVSPALVRAATFDEMRARAGELVPDRLGVLKDPGAFFRQGACGAWREHLSAEDHAAYLARASTLARGALLKWLHG